MKTPTIQALHTVALTGLLSLALLSPATAADFTGDLKGVTITDAQATNKPPTAAFTYSISGNTVTLNANGSIDPDGSIAKFQWHFGDGGAGTGATLVYTPSSLANLQVTLTVIDNQGAVALRQDTIAFTNKVGEVAGYTDGVIPMNNTSRYGIKLIDTPKRNGTLKSISAFISNDSGATTKRLKLALYSHNSTNDAPGTLIATTGELSSANVVGERIWLTGEVSGIPQVTAGTQYWVVIEALDKYASVARGGYGAENKTRYVEEAGLTVYNWSDWGASKSVNNNYPISVYMTHE